MQEERREEGRQLHKILEGKLTEQESLKLVLKLRALAVVSGDSSEEKLTRSMMFTHGDQLTADDMQKVCSFLTHAGGVQA